MKDGCGRFITALPASNQKSIPQFGILAAAARSCSETLVEDTDRMYYGFPYDPGNGLKMAGLHFGDRVDPDTVDREPSARDEERVRAWLRRRMPLANGERRRAQVCMYTNSPDGHFIIDREGPITYASACSGHGFKFASAVGEILADLTISGGSSLDIGFLSAARLATVAR